ncbi:MAG: hydrogenase maturation protease [Thaumarchaeota archaeon]|nr:hydrogenase maturation protease [Nitrososphaerota archaeon]
MSWKGRLEKLLAKPPEGGRIIFVGVGITLRGDDGIGVWIAEKLKSAVKRDDVEVLVIGDRVDILPRILRGRKPKLIIFFDAADFRGKPGEIKFMTISEASGRTISTHDIPIELMLKISEVNAPAYVVGVQIASIAFGERITPQVMKAGERILEFLIEKLSREGSRLGS